MRLTRLLGWLSERFGRDVIWRRAVLHVVGGCEAAPPGQAGGVWLRWDPRTWSCSIARPEHLARRRWCRACRERWQP